MKIFDIFAGTARHDAVWQCSAHGKSEALFVMKHLADEKPGPYFVYDLECETVVTVITGTTDPTLKPVKDNRKSSVA
jgi:hypothetical protein